jgi:hypothetical protein
MKAIYQTTIYGKILESRDLKKLLALAVTEKRAMDRKKEILLRDRSSLANGRSLMPAVNSGTRGLEQAG